MLSATGLVTSERLLGVQSSAAHRRLLRSGDSLVQRAKEMFRSRYLRTRRVCLEIYETFKYIYAILSRK